MGKPIHRLSVEEALSHLDSHVSGLDVSEANRRLQKFGFNQIQKGKGKSRLKELSRQFTHLFACLLWVAAGLSFLAEIFQPGQGMLTMGIAILGVIFINGLFSFWQEYRAERAIAALLKLLPSLVKVARSGEIMELPAEDLVPGDVVHLSEGDRVPADCRILETFSLRVNNAVITGESLPKSRNSDQSDAEELSQSKNILLAGTSIVSGHAKALVFETGMDTAFGKIVRLTGEAGEEASPLQAEIAHLSRRVATLAIIVGLVFFIIGRALGFPFWDNFVFAIGIIAALVPEGLLPTVTLALAMAAQRMAKRRRRTQEG